MHRAARQLGIRLIENLLSKSAAMHPIDQMRAHAMYNVGQQHLMKDLGIDPSAEMAALAENEAYANRLRELWDKHLAPTMSSASAPAITEENAPKVLQTPK